MNVLRSLLALVTSFLALITAFLCPTPQDTGTARLTQEKTLTFLDAFVCGQGLDSDGEYYYTSGSITAAKLTGLAKLDAATLAVVAQNWYALPQDMIDAGYDHIGDIAYYDGVIYAPSEGEADDVPMILLYDADDLSYTGELYELHDDSLTDGVPWCACDEQYLYVSRFSDADVVCVFDRNTGAFVRDITLSEPVDRIQAGDVYDGVLYLNCDPKDGNKTVYRVDLTTGGVTLVFDRNTTGYDTETEGMCVLPGGSGPVFHIADYNKLVSVFIRVYEPK